LLLPTLSCKYLKIRKERALIEGYADRFSLSLSRSLPVSPAHTFLAITSRTMEVPGRKKEEKDKIKSAFTFLSRSVDVHE
jgi:hypothetical protein